MAILATFLRKLRQFRDDERANPTVEFVIAVPVLFWIVFSVIEAGWLMTQTTRLDSGLNRAVRDLRLGLVIPDHANVKDLICEYSGILVDCDSTVHLELVPADSATASAAPTCVDRDTNIDPVIEFVPGSTVVPEVMMLRVCFVVQPLLPGAGIGSHFAVDANGDVHIVSYSAFANEPS